MYIRDICRWEGVKLSGWQRSSGGHMHEMVLGSDSDGFILAVELV